MKSDPSSERIPPVRYPDAVSGRRSKGRLLREALPREALPNPSHAPVVNVRAAKDRLSSLLEQVSRGDEVVITSDGRPKARLVPVRDESRPYTVDWDWLESQPLVGGPSAEVIVAADRADRCP